MRVVLVHYHLQRGGVTRIICHLQQVLLQRGINCLVLTGQAPGFALPGPFRVVPGLQYEACRPAVSARDLMQEMQAAAIDGLGGRPDLWHVHNHSLGKSMVLPSALALLAGQGERMIFHLHDFAEDGRPANYRALRDTLAGGKVQELTTLLYPQGNHLHYVVLNHRDFSYLQAAGLDASRLHLLANPVDLGTQPASPPPAVPSQQRFWLYPTRAIRRKNLGEFLLWAAVTAGTARFATTGAPENPVERPRYLQWKKIARQLDLPVLFEGVQPGGPSFTELLAQATGVLTTSVAEGFGMAFLEPWILGIPVYGRNLPEVTGGFAQEGISLPWIYDRLEIPVRWIGRDRLVQAARSGLERLGSAYGLTFHQDALERSLQAWIHEERVDFGRLDEVFQEEILRALVADPGLAGELQPQILPDGEGMQPVIEANQQCLQRCYALAQYGETIEQMYTQVLAATPCQEAALDGQALLAQFVAPERLFLLRVD